MFFKPNLVKTAADELYDAERKLLEAQTGLEYAKSQVDYQTARVARLREYLAEKRAAGPSTDDA